MVAGEERSGRNSRQIYKLDVGVGLENIVVHGVQRGNKQYVEDECGVGMVVRRETEERRGKGSVEVGERRGGKWWESKKGLAVRGEVEERKGKRNSEGILDRGQHLDRQNYRTTDISKF